MPRNTYVPCICLAIAVLLAFSAGCAANTPAPERIAQTTSAVVIATETPVIIANTSQPQVHTEIVSTKQETESDRVHRLGGLYLTEEYPISRSNVSGLKNLNADVSVYAYRFLDAYNESAADTWGTDFYWLRTPDPGQKFLFVFVKFEMLGTSGYNDPRMWGFDSHHFAVQYRGRIIQEDSGVTKCVLIKEMENTFTSNDEARIIDYGKLRVEDMQTPTNGISCDDLGFLRMGKSNAWDGYIIYQVPADATEKDLVVLGAFNGFGDAWWYLYQSP